MATIATLAVNLVANTADMFRTIDRDMAKLDKSLGTMGKKFTDAGKTLTAGLTLPLVGVAAGALKAASDFESSFAGVRKTVDATEPEFQAMAQQFRNLAKEIPVSVNELNALGESAGALGIPKQEIVGFAKVMAELGVTTNLTASEAADSIARIQNIFGAAGQDTDRLASTIVALGNAGASTEKEIVEMAQRIAGAGHAVGLSQDQVVAFASSLASVGINAEAGGSAISRTFLKMNDAVMAGGKGLTDFAQVAGMSAAQFKQKFETDAAGAMSAFIGGLQKIQKEGGNVNSVIEDNVGKSIVMKDTLLRLAGAGTLLSDQLNLGSKAWKDNTALAAEAGQRFGTTESQLQKLWNNVKDVSITLGQALIPFLQSAIARFKEWIPVIEGAANWFKNLSPSVQTAVLAVGALAAGIGPLLVVIGSMATGISTLIPIISGIGTAFTSMMGIIGPAGWVVLALGAIYLAWKNWDTIGPIVKGVYTAVKEWLLDRFQAVVDGIKGKVESVTGFFRGMYDAVVGHSYVPDMVTGIASEFGRLDTVMVGPTGKAASGVMGIFQSLAGQLPSMLQGLFNGGGSGGGGGLGGMLSGLLGGGSGGGLLGGGVTKGLTSMFNKFSPQITSMFGMGLSSALGAALPGVGAVIGPLVTKGLGKVWDGIKGLFGPSQGKKDGMAADDQIHAMQDELLQMYGSLDNIRQMGGAAGIELAAAWGDKNVAGLENFRAKMDEFTRAVEGAGVATKDTTAAGVLGFEQVHQTLDDMRVQAIGAGGTEGAGLLQAITTLEAQMQTAAESGVTDFGFMTSEIDAMKARIAEAIHIPVFVDWHDAVKNLPAQLTSEGGNSVSSDWQVEGMGGSWEAAREQFLRSNPGDEDRFIASMTDVGRIDEAMHNTPGFATGTGGRFVDFGRESLVRLHGKERVQTESEGRQESALSREVAELRAQNAEMVRAIRGLGPTLKMAFKAAMQGA